MKRSRLNPISQKQAKANAIYREKRKEYLNLNRMCEAGLVLEAAGVECDCTKWSTQVHHMRKRRKNLNNTDSWLPVCAPCHRWIEDHKSKARELGLLANIHDT